MLKSSIPVKHDINWNGIIKLGGISSLLCALMYLIAMGVYTPAYASGPTPSNPAEWFSLFQKSKITGLFFLGIADMIIMVLLGPLIIALSIILWQTNKTWVFIAGFIILIGIGSFITSNIAFPMGDLSAKYTRAATEIEKSNLIGAGEALIAMNKGSSIGMSLSWLGIIILSILILKNKLFRKFNGIIGIIGFTFLIASIPFADYTTPSSTTPLISAIIFITYSVGGLLSLAWYIMTGIKLLKIGFNKGT